MVTTRLGDDELISMMYTFFLSTKPIQICFVFFDKINAFTKYQYNYIRYYCRLFIIKILKIC